MNNYFKPESPGSFGGVKRLRRSDPNLSVKDAKRFLSSQRAYTLHKPIRRIFKRRKTIVSGIDSLWQADLADFQALSRYNKGYKYLLVVIDVFSKFLWIEPVKTKQATEILHSFLQILNRSSPRRPLMVMTDKGTEFAKLRSYLKERAITYYTSENVETKASVAERVIRTIKERLYRYFTHTKSNNFLAVLPKIVESYNKSIHRSIGMAPTDVTPQNQQLVSARLYGVSPRPKCKFDIGDQVRISKYKGAFEKGYKANWTEEIFSVAKKLKTVPPVYEIADHSGETILGRFYEQELQLVNQDNEV